MANMGTRKLFSQSPRAVIADKGPPEVQFLELSQLGQVVESLVGDQATCQTQFLQTCERIEMTQAFARHSVVRQIQHFKFRR